MSLTMKISKSLIALKSNNTQSNMPLQLVIAETDVQSILVNAQLKLNIHTD